MAIIIAFTLIFTIAITNTITITNTNTVAFNLFIIIVSLQVSVHQDLGITQG